MADGRPSEWPTLFDIAVQILRHVEAQIGFAPSWSFGGGTALMLQIDHRESHDIDLFFDDPPAAAVSQPGDPRHQASASSRQLQRRRNQCPQADLSGSRRN
ncbi:MAG: nucleotidyl transferase AbiEii/AbiGii toxin family protein [Sphingomonas sp.]